MTTTTHTVAAMLSVAVAALEAQNKAHKADTGEVLFALGADMGNGVKFRELKAWAKEFKAKQASVTPPKAAVVHAEPKTTTVKTAPKAGADVVELKATEVRDQVVLVGRSKETVTHIVKDKVTGVRMAVTDKGSRIPMADIERNNRGNLRVKLDAPAPTQKAEAAPKATAAPKTVAPKATATKKADDFEPESTVRTFPIRHLELKKSSHIVSAEYDRNTQTLKVAFKDGAAWSYEGVKLSQAKAFENAESAGAYFSAQIKNAHTGKMVKSGAKPAATEKAPVKPAAKAADVAHVFTGNELRDSIFMNGRKAETITKVVKDATGERVIVTDAGTRAAVSTLRLNNRGKFVVAEVEAPKAKPVAAKAPAKDVAENTRKTTGNKPAKFVEAAPVKQHSVEARPTINDVKDKEVRVVKGNKETLAKILRVVNRENVRYAITENRFPLPFNNIIFMDGQLTYTGKPLTAEEFRAL